MKGIVHKIYFSREAKIKGFIVWNNFKYLAED